jgi:periplasmic protein TonB
MTTTAFALQRVDHDDRRRDPLAGVTNLGVAGAVGASLAISAGLHAAVTQSVFVAWLLSGLMSWQDDLQTRIHERVLSEFVLEVEPEAKPPEPPKQEEKPKEELPKEELPKDTPKAEKTEQAAPAPAAAGQVVTSEAAEQPTDFGMLQGPGQEYTGGVTASDGISKGKVDFAVPKGTGPANSVGTAVAPTVAIKRDCARATRLRGGLAWDCSFPPEADTEQIDTASAVIEVAVNASGRVDSVRIVQDPGHGFGRAARACAMSKAFDAAIGDECTAITSTKSFRVNFNR